jgi:hypothetical protein
MTTIKEMKQSEREALSKAVNYLVQSDKYTTWIKLITQHIEEWDTYPRAFAEPFAYLNVLIEIGLKSRNLFENIIRLIENKRREIPATKRVDYQRTLMQERRARIAKALEIREQSGKKIRNSEERATLTAQLTKRWAKEKSAFIKAKGKISWKDRNAAMNEFWQGIDASLDSQLAALRKETA